LVTGGNVLLDWQWSPDGDWLAYRADQLTDNTVELFTASADGSANVLVSGIIADGGNVAALSGRAFQWSPDGTWLVYSADQVEDEKFELFVAAPDGGTTNLSVSGVLTSGGDVIKFALGARPGATTASTERRVALLGADPLARLQEVREKILGTGSLNHVDLIRVDLVTPSLTQLLSYDAVLVWSDFFFADSTTIGNVLADYVDSGGGVVAAVFAFDASTARLIGGRFRTSYYVITPSGIVIPTNLTLAADLPEHPLLSGVENFNGGVQSYQPSVNALESGATRIASWSNGMPLVATRDVNGVRRVDLGFYPPSSDSNAAFWDATTDGDLLMANALLYVMGDL
jgi:hypothetical protein